MTLKEARKLALAGQFLDGRRSFSRAEGAVGAIESLGYVQIDTISVIERAHHHTLWTRVEGYEPAMLNELLKNRRIFEYWGHAASYLPMADFRYYLPKMKEFDDPHGKWEKDRLQKFGHLMEPVLNRIREEGPLGSKDFELPQGKKKGENWWDWHEMKGALELLYWKGELMVSERRQFQKVYDLTGRVLPEGLDNGYPGEEELGEFLVGRALRSHGAATEQEIAEHIHAAGKNVVVKALKRLVESKQVEKITIADTDNKIYYTTPDALETVGRIEIMPAVHILSPFDNLVIQRERLKNLFGFDYVLECYVPPKKRVNGYFVLPVLFGDGFAGRMDAKAERKSGTLIVRNLLMEPGFCDFDAFLPLFSDKLREFARFNGCETIVFENVTPKKIRNNLKRLI